MQDRELLSKIVVQTLQAESYLQYISIKQT